MTDSLVHHDSPLRVYWEVTRACALACVHCRAEAAPHADPRELDHAAGLRLLDRLAEATSPPHLVLTGGDPLARPDLFELIAHARRRGLDVSLSPAATPALDASTLDRIEAAGVDAISLSLDGASATTHDAIRKVDGTFERTMRAARHAAKLELPFQINTLVSAETVDEMPAIERRVRAMGAARWSLFFLVNVGRGSVLTPIDAARAEALLAWLAERADDRPGPIFTTTEAPQYRRVLAQRRARHARVAPVGDRARPAGHGHAAGIRDGNGVMFIAHDGEITPSGFLPVTAGNAKLRHPLRVYREAPLFQALRDVDRFGGRCGRCEFRKVCGGSRARAWAKTDDVLAEDPLCPYAPGTRAETAHGEPS